MRKKKTTPKVLLAHSEEGPGIPFSVVCSLLNIELLRLFQMRQPGVLAHWSLVPTVDWSGAMAAASLCALCFQNSRER